MSENNRTAGEIIKHGMFGAFLGAIILISIQWCFGPIGQNYVFLGAVFGFILGVLFGESAIEFLKEVFSWS